MGEVVITDTRSEREKMKTEYLNHETRVSLKVQVNRVRNSAYILYFLTRYMPRPHFTYWGTTTCL